MKVHLWAVFIGLVIGNFLFALSDRSWGKAVDKSWSQAIALIVVALLQWLGTR